MMIVYYDDIGQISLQVIFIVVGFWIMPSDVQKLVLVRRRGPMQCQGSNSPVTCKASTLVSVLSLILQMNC